MRRKQSVPCHCSVTFNLEAWLKRSGNTYMHRPESGEMPGHFICFDEANGVYYSVLAKAGLNGKQEVASYEKTPLGKRDFILVDSKDGREIREIIVGGERTKSQIQEHYKELGYNNMVRLGKHTLRFSIVGKPNLDHIANVFGKLILDRAIEIQES